MILKHTTLNVTNRRVLFDLLNIIRQAYNICNSAYSFRSTYKLLMAGTTTGTVTSPSPPPLPPSSTLASATAAADPSCPPPRLRSDSPLRLPPPAALNLINRFVRADVRLNASAAVMYLADGALVFVCLRCRWRRLPTPPEVHRTRSR